MSAKLELKDFIKRARGIHGKKYGYAAVRYRNIDSRVKIKCPIHGYFDQIAWNHIGRPRSGCPKCGDLRMADKRRSKNANAFIKEARRVHGHRYDYSKSAFKSVSDPICVKCPKHGEFWPTPFMHIKGRTRCPKCAKKESAIKVIRRFEKEFIKRAREVHGQKYDYSVSKYLGATKPIKIVCRKHGHFIQNASNHLAGYGCEKCGRERLRELFSFSNKEFLRRAKNEHGSRYSYLTKYKNNNTPIKIRCPEHGVFFQRPANHLKGEGCRLCSMKKAGMNKRATHGEFVHKVKKVHPRYTFPDRYITAVKKINVRCRKHGLFRMSPNLLLNGHGCKKCDDERSALRQRLTHDEFLERCREVHGAKYRYPHKYKGGRVELKIICPKHGGFLQKASNHLIGNGCPVCFDSSGERKVSRALESLKVHFVRQKKFPDLVHKKQLRFDFWLPSFKTLIEFDGIQHFQASSLFGGKKAFEQTRLRDRIKNTWARRMKLPLIRIPYTHPMPEEVLRKHLGI